MKLGETVDQIMAAHGWDQTTFGAQIGARQSMVSRMRKGEDWEQHWQIFLKLLPLCRDLGIDPAGGIDSKATSAIKPPGPDEVVLQLGRWATRNELGRKNVADSATPYEPVSTAQSQKEITRSYPTRRDAARKRPKRKH